MPFWNIEILQNVIRPVFFRFLKKENLQKLYKNFTRINSFWKIQDSRKKSLPEFKGGLAIDSFRSVMTFITDKVCRVTYCMINSEDDCALNYTAIDGILPFFSFYLVSLVSISIHIIRMKN